LARGRLLESDVVYLLDKSTGKLNIDFLKICFSVSPSFREGHRLRVCGGGVLRRICGPQRDEIIGGWRELCNEEVH
jgi:hypothetical protein